MERRSLNFIFCLGSCLSGALINCSQVIAQDTVSVDSGGANTGVVETPEVIAARERAERRAWAIRLMDRAVQTIDTCEILNCTVGCDPNGTEPDGCPRGQGQLRSTTTGYRRQINHTCAAEGRHFPLHDNVNNPVNEQGWMGRCTTGVKIMFHRLFSVTMNGQGGRTNFTEWRVSNYERQDLYSGGVLPTLGRLAYLPISREIPNSSPLFRQVVPPARLLDAPSGSFCRCLGGRTGIGHVEFVSTASRYSDFNQGGRDVSQCDNRGYSNIRCFELTDEGVDYLYNRFGPEDKAFSAFIPVNEPTHCEYRPDPRWDGKRADQTDHHNRGPNGP